MRKVIRKTVDRLRSPRKGRGRNFVKGEGPILEKLNVKNVLNIKDQEFLKKLRPVYDAIAITRKKLRKDKE